MPTDTRLPTGRDASASFVAAACAYGLVLASPAVAWLVWISGSGDKASDARHGAWFATVAVGCLLAGVLAPRRIVHLLALWTVAIVSTMVTLYAWWSASDSSGLFVIGLILAAPLVAGGAVALLLAGLRLNRGSRPPVS